MKKVCLWLLCFMHQACLGINLAYRAANSKSQCLEILNWLPTTFLLLLSPFFEGFYFQKRKKGRRRRQHPRPRGKWVLLFTPTPKYHCCIPRITRRCWIGFMVQVIHQILSMAMYVVGVFCIVTDFYEG